MSDRRYFPINEGADILEGKTTAERRDDDG